MYRLLLFIIALFSIFEKAHPVKQPTFIAYSIPRKQEPGFRQLDTMVRKVAVNNEVLLMLVDKGYYNMFMSNYIYGKLDKMSNVVVSVMDIGTYYVLPQI